MNRTRSTIALGALSACCFVSVTSENLPVALLPQLAAGFEVSESAIGLLVSGYAVVVAVTVVPLVALAGRWDRRRTTLVTVGAIVLSNLVLAIAPSYGVAMAARVVSAAGHGVFWSVVAPMAVGLLGADRAGRATAVVFAGNALAFLAGLPLGSWLGATIGWRPTVLAMAALAALAGLAVLVTVDPQPAPAGGTVLRWDRIRAVATDRALAGVDLATVALITGQFAAFTYITVIISRYTGLSSAGTSALLLAHGAAGLVGLWLVGRSVDRNPRLSALAVATGLSVCMLIPLVAGAGPAAGAAVLLWGLPTSGMAVVLQAGVLRAAPAEPDLASSFYIVAFQIGIAAGAWIGGLFVDRGSVAGALTAAAIGGVAAAVVIHRSSAFSARQHLPAPGEVAGR